MMKLEFKMHHLIIIVYSSYNFRMSFQIEITAGKHRDQNILGEE